jgi:KDO2-lipid IV(A) lauroyltransferase
MVLLGRLTNCPRSLKDALDGVAYLLLRAVWAALALLPLAVTRRALESLSSVIGRWDRRHREVIARNLSIAFPELSGAERDRITDQAFRNWGRIAAELVHSAAVVDSAERGWVGEVEAVATGLLREGTGLLVLTAHIGNFELVARIWGVATGRRISVLHRAMGNRFADGFLRRERAAMNVDTLERGVAAREILVRLRAGGMLAAPLDQNQPPGRPGVFVDLFGRPAATATVLARLSVATGAPVLPVFAVWTDSGPDAVVGRPVLPPVGPIPVAQRAEVIHSLTAAYNREIEAAVRRHPDQWNWAHRRWKTRPEEPVKASRS